MKPLFSFNTTMSIKRQLFVALAVLSLLPLFAVSYFAQNVMWKASVGFISQNAHQDVADGAQRVDDYFQHLEMSATDLAIDPQFQKLISLDPTSEAALAIYINSIRDSFQKLVQSRSDINAVLLIDRSGHAFHYSKDLTVFNYSFDFANDPIYKRIYDFNQPQLIGPHKPPYYGNQPQDEVVSLVVPVKNYIDYTIGEWIVIELDKADIEKLVGQLSASRTSVFLYNRASGGLVKGNSLPGGSLLPLAGFIAGQKEEDTGELIVNRRKYQTAYRSLHFPDWTIVSMTPLDDLLRGVSLTRTTTFGIALLSFLLAFLFAVVFLRQLLKPLYSLKNGMTAFSRGIAVRVRTNARNELGFLIKTFNQMLDDRQQLELELRQTSMREKEKELLQLQAQINPHFLFNTLGTIQTLALQNRKAELEEAVYSVAQMLRYNARNDQGWAMLRDEIAYIRHFHSIHHLRYEQEAVIDYDIPAECLDIPVIKLSLQPFVENALKYGWKADATGGSFKASITARLQEGRVEIAVLDNGPGFEADTLAVLRGLPDYETGRSNTFFTDHIGIWNVYRRLRLVYGPAFSMDIANRAEGGAAVTLVFPVAVE